MRLLLCTRGQECWVQDAAGLCNWEKQRVSSRQAGKLGECLSALASFILGVPSPRAAVWRREGPGSLRGWSWTPRSQRDTARDQAEEGEAGLLQAQRRRPEQGGRRASAGQQGGRRALAGQQGAHPATRPWGGRSSLAPVPTKPTAPPPGAPPGAGTAKMALGLRGPRRMPGTSLWQLVGDRCPGPRWTPPALRGSRHQGNQERDLRGGGESGAPGILPAKRDQGVPGGPARAQPRQGTAGPGTREPWPSQGEQVVRAHLQDSGRRVTCRTVADGSPGVGEGRDLC